MSHDFGEYAGRIERWIDGDTVDVLTLNTETSSFTRFGVKTTVAITQEELVRYRLVLVDTPERGEPGWAEATAYCRSILPAGTWTQVITHGENGAFGRVMADILVPDQGGTTISSLLLQHGYAELWQ